MRRLIWIHGSYYTHCRFMWRVDQASQQLQLRQQLTRCQGTTSRWSRRTKTCLEAWWCSVPASSQWRRMLPKRSTTSTTSASSISMIKRNMSRHVILDYWPISYACGFSFFVISFIFACFELYPDGKLSLFITLSPSLLNILYCMSNYDSLICWIGSSATQFKLSEPGIFYEFLLNCRNAIFGAARKCWWLYCHIHTTYFKVPIVQTTTCCK